MKSDFTHATQTAPYSVTYLQPADSDLMKFLGLQDIAQMIARSDRAHHLKMRSVDDLRAHLDARMPIIGVHSAQGDYVAHALLAYPVHDDAVRNLTHYPFKGMEPTTAVIQSLFVLPQHRPSKQPALLLEKAMDPIGLIFDTAKDIAATHGHTQIMAKVAVDNIKSREVFEQNGFSVYETHFDETGGYMAHYLLCQLYAAPCLAAQVKNAISFERTLIPA